MKIMANDKASSLYALYYDQKITEGTMYGLYHQIMSQNGMDNTVLVIGFTGTFSHNAITS